MCTRKLVPSNGLVKDTFITFRLLEPDRHKTSRARLAIDHRFFGSKRETIALHEIDSQCGAYHLPIYRFGRRDSSLWHRRSIHTTATNIYVFAPSGSCADCVRVSCVCVCVRCQNKNRWHVTIVFDFEQWTQVKRFYDLISGRTTGTRRPCGLTAECKLCAGCVRCVTPTVALRFETNDTNKKRTRTISLPLDAQSRGYPSVDNAKCIVDGE